MTARTSGQRPVVAAWSGARNGLDLQPAACDGGIDGCKKPVARNSACNGSELEGDAQESSMANRFA